MTEEQKTSTKAKNVREFMSANPDKKPADVVGHFKETGVVLTEGYVRQIKARSAKGKTSGEKVRTASANTSRNKRKAGTAKYPRHSLERALRIPRGILEQNAGKACSEKQSASFIGVKFNRGPFTSELSSCIKFGLLERPQTGQINLTDLARRILRPQNSDDELHGLREAILKAPEIADVYEHFRGENLPEEKFFHNALLDTFRIPQENLQDFVAVFMDSLRYAKLIEERGDRIRVLDFSGQANTPKKSEERLRAMGKDVKVEEGDSCFVMMPFAAPLGDYYSLVYKPAIEKAGLKAVRADDDIFATGKIMDQVWRGITGARVLVAELTSRNANVFYELGLAHALKKPVVLVSATETDVPFDLHHIRVIYYDKNDPFWGQKLIDKVAENIVSALRNPDEAMFETIISKKA